MSNTNWQENYIRKNVGNNEVLIQKILQLAQKMPLSKIFQEKYFWKSRFKTNKHTLDPRSDTETIVELITKRYDKSSQHTILELGVGTGAFIISILMEFPLWSGFGVDISHKALKIARYNVRNHKAPCVLSHNNWLENNDRHYDVLIANPPYLEAHEYGDHLHMDPKLALIEPSDLYFYKEIAKKAHQFKHIFLEINCNRNINDYITLFSAYTSIIHYTYDHIPICIEILISTKSLRNTTSC